MVVKLVRPLTTGHTTFYERNIWIIKIVADDKEFAGEVSPLPGFNSENTATVELSFNLFNSHLNEKKELNSLQDIVTLLHQFSSHPAFKSGLEQVLLQAYTSIHAVPLTELLNKERSLTSLPVNATIGILDTQETIEHIRELMDTGFRCIKMKVGRKYLDDDIRIVNAVFDAFGDKLEIRLDANRCWKFSYAVTFFQGINHLPVSYIEEPVADFAQFRALRNFTHIPLAADESIIDTNTAEQVIREHLADVLIIKPGVFGGILSSMDIIQKIMAHDKQVTVTSSLDTPLGKRKAVVTAALLDRCSPCGLDTVRLLADNPFDDFYPVVNAQIFCEDLCI